MSDRPKCKLYGEPMPEGEEMFKYHGYSGNCPKPPLPKGETPRTDAATDFTAPEKLRDLCRKLERELSAQSSREKALEMQMAGLVEGIKKLYQIAADDILYNTENPGPNSWYKHTKKVYGEVLREAQDEALANLDVSKYRRLMEAVALLCDDDCGINLGAKLDRVREAFRAIKP